MILLRLIFMPVLATIPVTVLGLVFLWEARRIDRKSRQLWRWSETTGRILEVAIAEKPGRGRRMRYQVKATYEYVVAGQHYQSRQINLSDYWRAINSKPEAEAECRKYPPGQAVKVYYDPDHPTDAVVDLTMHNTTESLLIFGHLFFWAGFLIGSAVLIGSLQTCGITLKSLKPAPNTPDWCHR